MGKRHPPKTKTKLITDDYGIKGLIYKQENHGRPINLSKAMTRPAYAGTSIEQKQIFHKSICEGCGYWSEPDPGRPKDCTFPWGHPMDADIAVAQYLPCKEEYYAEDI